MCWATERQVEVNITARACERIELTACGAADTVQSLLDSHHRLSHQHQVRDTVIG
jgi:hypothetical protein